MDTKEGVGLAVVKLKLVDSAARFLLGKAGQERRVQSGAIAALHRLPD